MRIALIAALLPLAACDIEMIQPGDDNALVGNQAAEPLSPGTRAVPIGESGPQFAACATRGLVANLAPGAALPVRAAPFAEAEQLGALATGRRLHVCSRSIDQRWLGVVVPAEGESPPDCGVSAPAERGSVYHGQCLAGWVASGFVRLTAN